MPEKKPKRDASRWVKGSTFRLSDDTLADLDLIAEHLSRTTGVRHTRTDAIRATSHREAEKLRKKEK